MRDKILKYFVVTFTLGYLFLAGILPNILVLVCGVTDFDSSNYSISTFTIGNIKEAFSSIFILSYLRSIETGAVVLSVCMVLGYFFAYIVYLIRNKILKYLLLSMLIIPFWTSSLIRSYALVSILRLNGYLNNILIFFGLSDEPISFLYNPYAVIFGYTYALIPFMIIPLYISLQKIDYRLLETAEDLGASKFTTFMKIILPLTKDGIISGSSIVLLSSFSMFYLSDLFGGAKYQLIGNLIKNQFLITYNWGLGSAITMVLYIFIIFFLIIQKKALNSDLEETSVR